MLGSRPSTPSAFSTLSEEEPTGIRWSEAGVQMANLISYGVQAEFKDFVPSRSSSVAPADAASQRGRRSRWTGDAPRMPRGPRQTPASPSVPTSPASPLSQGPLSTPPPSPSPPSAKSRTPNVHSDRGSRCRAIHVPPMTGSSQSQGRSMPSGLETLAPENWARRNVMM